MLIMRPSLIYPQLTSVPLDWIQRRPISIGKQVIGGLSESRITGAVKHFPGNGRTNIDPHVESSSVTADQMDLENNDIYPFKKMIETVDNNQFFVMVTDIKYPAYEMKRSQRVFHP